MYFLLNTNKSFCFAYKIQSIRVFLKFPSDFSSFVFLTNIFLDKPKSHFHPYFLISFEAHDMSIWSLFPHLLLFLPPYVSE